MEELKNGIEVQTSIEKLTTTVKEAHTANIKSVEAANTVIDKTITAIEKHGMSDDYDAKIKALLKKLGATVTSMKKNRNPATAIVDAVKKEFTSLENSLGKKSEKYILLVKFRDDYAAEKLKKANEEKEKIQIEAEKEAEKNELFAYIELCLSSHFDKYLKSRTGECDSQFEGLRLINDADYSTNEKSIKTGINQIQTILPSEIVSNFLVPGVHSEPKNDTKLLIKHLNNAEKGEIKKNALIGKYEMYSKMFTEELTDYKIDLVTKLPEATQELIETAKAENATKEAKAQKAIEAAKKKKEELEKIKEQKRIDSEKQKKADEEKRQKDIAAKIESDKKARELQSIVQNSTNESVLQSAKTSVKTEWKITVTNIAGYEPIIAMWLQYAAKENMELDKVAKTSINKMITYAEKEAKTDLFIDSEFVIYEEIAKTDLR